MSDSIIDINKVSVSFLQKGKRLDAVKDVSLSINRGDIYGIVGYSGAGKSTLSRTINLLQKPTSGAVVVDNKTFFDSSKSRKPTISSKELRIERQKIGMIFQHFNLLNEQTVVQNVEFALKHSKLKEKQVQQRAQKLLGLVGLSEYANTYPAQLSGGQQQRVAIARALANDPKILISDESTSALDPQNTNQILDLLKRLNSQLGLTVILITHEIDAVKRIANKAAVMDAGQIIESGSIVDVFVHPQKQLTKTLIGFNEGPKKAISILNSNGLKLNPSEQYIKLTYFGNEVSEPVVINLYKDLDVTANIIYSNVDILGNTLVGTMFIIIDGKSENVEKAIDYLRERDINIEKLDRSEVNS